MSVEEPVYTDIEGLRRLAQQLDVSAPTKVSTTLGTSNSSTRGAKSKFGLTALSILGLSTKFEGELSRVQAGNQSVSIETTPDAADHLKQVRPALKAKGRLYLDPYNAWTAALSSDRNSFCDIVSDFFPLEWDSEAFDQWRVRANRDKFLVMYNYEDRKLRFGMSLYKIEGIRNDKIPAACHLTIRLRRGRTKLRVFGNMDPGKYIKPFFVTYVSG
jgi:hypothetical protein